LIEINEIEKKHWKVVDVERNRELDIKLTSSSVTNKFGIVVEFVKRMIEFNPDFGHWFFDWLEDCGSDDPQKNSRSYSELDTIREFVDNFLDELNLQLDEFVDESKAKKNSIFFTVEDIDSILRLSSYLKVYSFILNADPPKQQDTEENSPEPKPQFNLYPGATRHREIYNTLAHNVITSDVVSKIFDVIKTRTFKYNMSDKFMWEYIKTLHGKDMNVHIIETFNFIMNNIIILCEESKNPIIYFVSVIEESIKWFLKSVYRGTIVYDDTIATQDIHGIHVNNVMSFSFNDTLGKLKVLASNYATREMETNNKIKMLDENQKLIDFVTVLKEIEWVSPLSQCLVYPLLSKITDVTYIHFNTLSPEYSAPINFYCHSLLKKVFKGAYREVFALLDYYPTKQPSTFTTYRIKDYKYWVDTFNKYQSFFGFKNTQVFHEMLCFHVGRIARVNWKHLITGDTKEGGLPMAQIEKEMIDFYVRYFSGNLSDEIAKLQTLFDESL
jgi:hypothetical protein